MDTDSESGPGPDAITIRPQRTAAYTLLLAIVIPMTIVIPLAAIGGAHVPHDPRIVQNRVVGLLLAIIFGGGLLFLNYVKGTFALTYAPETISWSDYFGSVSFKVADVANCTIEMTNYRWSYYTLAFHLRDGTTATTRKLATQLFPTVVTELKRRYRFPIVESPG